MIHATDAIYKLAASFVRPITYDYMSLDMAYAHVSHEVLRLGGEVMPYEPKHVISGARHVLDTRLQYANDKRDVAAMRIRRLLKPMVAAHAKPGALLAEAHGVNGADGFPFSEKQVNEMVRMFVWQQMSRHVA